MTFETDLKTAFKSAMHRGDADFWFTDFCRTGIAPLDWALGGGFGIGRTIELFGNWSSGKTMVLYYALAWAQKQGWMTVLFESEGAFDKEFFRALGGDPEKIYVYPLDTAEDFFDGVMSICDLSEKSGVKVIVGWDSIAATCTKHLLDVGMDKRDMSKAGVMSFGTQLITTKVKKCDVCVIATNQTREQIGSMDSATHTPGGRSWPFHASQRVELRFDGGSKSSLIFNREEDQKIGRWIKGEVVKNKLAAPFKTFVLPIYVEPGHWHPAGYQWATTLGIDKLEALFHFYANHYRMASGRRLLKRGAWCQLNSEFAVHENFRAKEWPEIVREYPILWELPYAHPGSDGGSVDSSVGEDGSTPSEGPGEGGDQASSDESTASTSI